MLRVAWLCAALASLSLAALAGGNEPVKLERYAGTYTVPVRINDALILKFIIDSGASDTQIPADVVLTLFRTGTVSESDFIGSRTYGLADGSEVPSDRFIVRELRVGEHVARDVVAAIGSAKGDPLLGQSFLSKFPAWMIDNLNLTLMLGEQAGSAGKSPSPAAFDLLLKDLTREHVAQAGDAPLQPHRQTAAAAPSSQPKAPLGAQLTASEMDLLREQLYHCWSVPVGVRDAKDLVIEIRVAVGPDGVARQAAIVDQGRLGDPIFRAAAESARRTFFAPECTPLRVPAGKYELWKDLVVDFDPRRL